MRLNLFFTSLLVLITVCFFAQNSPYGNLSREIQALDLKKTLMRGLIGCTAHIPICLILLKTLINFMGI